VVAAVLGLALWAPATSAAAIDEYSIPVGGGEPFEVAAGSDGALWFTQDSPNKIGRFTTGGTYSEYSIPSAASEPRDIVSGPDGALWFTEQAANMVTRVDTDGNFTEYSVPTPSSSPTAITAGPDGALWFTEQTGANIGRITTTGDFTEFPVPSAPGFGIEAGPDGALWFTEFTDNKIGRITTTGDVTEYPIPTAGSEPVGITAGSDGALWFAEQAGNKIGRITTAGDITEYPIPTPASKPWGITAGSDGALWFTQHDGSRIGRITTGGAITGFPTPTAGSGPDGIAAGPDGALWFAEFNADKVGRITADGDAPVDSVSQDAAAAGTVSTNTATSAPDQLGTSVTTPIAGMVTVVEGATTTPDPSGYSLVGQEVQLTAPDASAADPVVLQFRLDTSLLPPAADETNLQVFRNGTLVADCDSGAGTTATPDPCVAGRAATAGGVELTARTSQASTWSFGLDSVPPNTTITFSPPNPTKDSTPTFGFSTNEPGSSFECRFDSAAFGACSGATSHTPAGPLTDGFHTFQVRAVDQAQNPDPTPSSRTFAVDTTPPNTTITGPAGKTHDPTPTFTLSSNAGNPTFQCRLDNAAYSPCTSPKTVGPLTEGQHKLFVRARDVAGNLDPTPAARTITVETMSVAVSGASLVISAATAVKDNIQVSRVSPTVLRVTNLPAPPYSGSGLHTGAGCTRLADRAANCNASGVRTIQVTSGSQNDRVVNETGIRGDIDGGGHNDVLVGGSGGDSITGGGGADSMKGMEGNDQLFARDFVSDTLIACDGGSTQGTADRADLDKLPTDPNNVVTGCETKTRH
jgi:virginiamycin B lyase